MKVLVAPYSCSPWVFPILPTWALLREGSSVDCTLRSIPEHLFTCLLDIRVYSFGKSLLISFTHIPLTFFFCYLIEKNLKNTLWVCRWINWWEYFSLVPWVTILFYSIFCWTQTSLSQECFLFLVFNVEAICIFYLFRDVCFFDGVVNIVFKFNILFVYG